MAKVEDFSPAGEEAIIATMVATFLERQEKMYKPGTTARRALHGKSLGVYKGKLIVGDLPENLRVGLFAQPGQYDTVMRFSNGGLPETAPDILPNVRGMALKIYGVDGAKLLPGEENSDEQDFIMANFPTFFVSTAEQMLFVIQGRLLELLAQKPVVAVKTLQATAPLITSLLDIDYYSQVPHSFGGAACKYALLHQPGSTATVNPNFLERDYLRQTANLQLTKATAKFTLAVQLQQKGESIDDPVIEWRSPYVPLAQLVLNRIEAVSKGMPFEANAAKEIVKESDGEDLSFNPCRSIEEHVAISWPGRMRRAVYAADFEWRQKKNQTR
jgi:hypothetical protein